MNFIALAQQQAANLIAASAAKITDQAFKPPVIEAPKDPRHGDWASGFAMQNAKALGLGNPRDFAQKVVDGLDFTGTYFYAAEIAGPGFINLRLSHSWFEDAARCILNEGERFGCSVLEHPEKIMVEFVSANPTGPMTIGNARGGALGDSLAEVLHRAGHIVEREFYINDAGNQIDKFAQSLLARYKQLILGEDAIDFPEDGYKGEDIRELAQAYLDAHGDRLALGDEALSEALAQYGLSVNIPRMKRDLERYRITFDTWFRESSLYDANEVAETVQKLTENGHTYEADGALWLKSTAFGTEKDDVLRRSNGFFTYFAADIAYHRNKLLTRGFDKVINIWGADHHGHVLRLQKAVDAIGLDGTNRLEIVIMQMVRLMRDGQVAKVSKRSGRALTLADLMDEMPVDAVRFFFNSRASDTHLEFDMDLALRKDRENPVYYVQYAHARTQSVNKGLLEDGVNVDVRDADLSLLVHEKELALIRELARLPEEIRLAAEQREPARINRYAADVATALHRFYDDDACHIRRAESEALRDARIFLTNCTAVVLKNALSCFGVEAPDSM